MKARIIGLFSIMLVVLSLSAVAQTAPIVSIEKAEIDGTDINPFGSTELDIERESDFELELEIKASQDVKDVEIRAFVSGYEYNDVANIGDIIGPFDFDANVRYKRSLTLSLPEDVETGKYRLRVLMNNKDALDVSYWYTLNVDTERHKLDIVDVVMENQVKAGSALTPVVRVENDGQKDQKDVRVQISIPDLSVSDVKYLEELEASEEEQTEEFFLRLPRCAKAGQYEVLVGVEYNRGHDSIVKKGVLTVLENEACVASAAPVVQENAVVAEPTTQKIRSALEIVLFVLIALLVIIGLIIGFSRLKQDD